MVSTALGIEGVVGEDMASIVRGLSPFPAHPSRFASGHGNMAMTTLFVCSQLENGATHNNDKHT